MASDEDMEKARILKGPERIRKLKEIEERKKKELEEAESLLRVAVDEESAEVERKEKLPIPQVAAVDISFLMTESERAIFRTRRFAAAHEEEHEVEALEEQKLEELAEEAAMASLNIQPVKIYGEAFEQSIEQAKGQLYGPAVSVTGFSRNEEPMVREFYDNIKGFYEMGSDNTSEYFRNRTTTGVEEQAGKKGK